MYHLPAGLWLAPQMVGEALKGGRLAAEVLSKEGFNVIPAPGRANPWSFITGECGGRGSLDGWAFAAVCWAFEGPCTAEYFTVQPYQPAGSATHKRTAQHPASGQQGAPCSLPHHSATLLPLFCAPAAVELGSKERMVAFCRAVQQCCPIGSYIQPVPGQGLCMLAHMHWRACTGAHVSSCTQNLRANAFACIPAGFGPSWGCVACWLVVTADPSRCLAGPLIHPIRSDPRLWRRGHFR